MLVHVVIKEQQCSSFVSVSSSGKKEQTLWRASKAVVLYLQAVKSSLEGRQIMIYAMHTVICEPTVNWFICSVC